MEFLDILATAIVQGIGFTVGMLIVVSVIVFGVKRKTQKEKLSIFKILKNATWRGV